MEDIEFRAFVQLLNSGYRLPSRKTISNSLLPKYYNEVLDQVKDQIRWAKAVCLTTEGWSSSQNESFLAVTAHYIRDGNLTSCLLQCFKYDEAHTSVNLCTLLKEVTTNWTISDKVACVITDNANNMKGAIRLCKWKHIPCFAHSINLVVQKGIKCISGIIEKV